MLGRDSLAGYIDCAFKELTLLLALSVLFCVEENIMRIKKYLNLRKKSLEKKIQIKE